MGADFSRTPSHPALTRRGALQAGAIGLMGLGLPDLSKLRAGNGFKREPSAKSVIFVFLTGGLSHLDSFDLKPEAPDNVRGEFGPIATRTPGVQISEHLPLLAQRTDKYAMIRSVGTDNNGHEIACHMLLTGRLDLPAGFSTNIVPSPNEWPSIPSLVTHATRGHNNLPPAIVLPEPSVNEVGRFRPGQYAGLLGSRYEAWHVDMASKCVLGNGACPHCFRFEGTPHEHAAKTIFDTPALTLPGGGEFRLNERVELLKGIERQRRDLDRGADVQKLDSHRQRALSLLTDPQIMQAFDVENADPQTLTRYGKNKFGLSLLMAYRLIDSGVNLVQVNLGKNSSWDTHRRNFVNLKDNLLPYFDRSLSALLDDLHDSGLIEDTLVVVAGEFGRTPKINKDAGRDHWAPVMTMLMAGGGIRNGAILGASDKQGAYPISDKQTPADIAATMFDALGIPQSAIWQDTLGRPHRFYHGEPIKALMG